MHSDTIVYIVLLLIFLSAVFLLIYTVRKRAKGSKKARDLTASRLGADMSATLTHISGLPVARSLPVEMYYGQDKITFISGGQEVSVSRDKITSIDTTLTGATRRIPKSTAATFRALAAIKMRLIISYISGGKAKNITLDASSCSAFASKVVDDFRKTSPHRHSRTEL